MNILKEAESLVYGDREKDYGSPLDVFTRTAKMWSSIIGHEVTAKQVALCMVALKISRECHKPKRDNLVDGAGYFATIEKMGDEQNLDEKPMYTLSQGCPKCGSIFFHLGCFKDECLSTVNNFKCNKCSYTWRSE